VKEEPSSEEERSLFNAVFLKERGNAEQTGNLPTKGDTRKRKR